jgi:hypothetical protein
VASGRGRQLKQQQSLKTARWCQCKWSLATAQALTVPPQPQCRSRSCVYILPVFGSMPHSLPIQERLHTRRKVPCEQQQQQTMFLTSHHQNFTPCPGSTLATLQYHWHITLTQDRTPGRSPSLAHILTGELSARYHRRMFLHEPFTFLHASPFPPNSTPLAAPGQSLSSELQMTFSCTDAPPPLPHHHHHHHQGALGPLSLPHPLSLCFSRSLSPPPPSLSLQACSRASRMAGQMRICQCSRGRPLC